MALQFNPPSWLQPRQYPNVAQSLDQIFSSAIQDLAIGKQMEQMDRENKRQQTEQALKSLEMGIDLNAIGQNSQAVNQAIGYANTPPTTGVAEPAMSPLTRSLVDYVNRNRAMQGFKFGGELAKEGIDPTMAMRTLYPGVQQLQPQSPTPNAPPMPGQGSTPAIPGVQPQPQNAGDVLSEMARKQHRKMSMEAEKPATDIEKQLREEYRASSVPFIGARDAYNNMIAASQTPGGASDLALLMNYVRLQNPAAATRGDGQLDMAIEAGSYGSQVMNTLRKIKKSGLLDPGERADYLGRARDIFQTRIASQDNVINEYARLAESNGVSRDRVIVNFGRGSETISPVAKGKPLAPKRSASLRASPDARFNALKKQGLSDEAAYAKMAREGH